MGLLLLIPGIILMEFGPWFADQAAVGEAMTWVGAIILAIQLIWFLIVLGIGLLGASKI